MKKQMSFVASSLLFVSLLPAQPGILKEKSFSFASTTAAHDAQPLSNSVTDIVVAHDTLWLGTGKGLSRSIDGGNTWKNYYGTQEFGTEDISAIAVRGKDVWVATAHSIEKDNSSLPVGSGFRHSTDGGDTWVTIAQPVDKNNVDTLYYNDVSLIRALGITTDINNITYDIALTHDAVWICSFAGMTRRSTDNGQTWERVILPPDDLDAISPTDTLNFDLSPSGGALGLQNNLNHRTFSVIAENDSTVWVGTAGGINKTTDNGRSWKKFSHTNEANPISGNFVVALDLQKTAHDTILWAATINAEGSTEKRGVSYSHDGGLTWTQTLIGEFPHNFGFKGDIVYVPTDNGIFRSDDFGVSWIQSGSIVDRKTHQHYTQSDFYSAASLGDTAWFGGSDGVIKTVDSPAIPFGTEWSILHASQPLASASAVYAYPNPFAPGAEVVRIHYSTNGQTSPVTVRIFDFGMNLIRTIIQNATRSGSGEHDEIWDGKDDRNNNVPNNVYFFQVTVGSNDPQWGKILVLR